MPSGKPCELSTGVLKVTLPKRAEAAGAQRRINIKKA